MSLACYDAEKIPAAQENSFDSLEEAVLTSRSHLKLFPQCNGAR